MLPKKSVAKSIAKTLFSYSVENTEIDLKNEVSQNSIYSDTYNEKSPRRMRFVKVEDIWLHKELQASTPRPTEEKPNVEWIPSNMLEIPKTKPAYAQIDYPSCCPGGYPKGG